MLSDTNYLHYRYPCLVTNTVLLPFPLAVVNIAYTL
jgi:hypothetical protein